MSSENKNIWLHPILLGGYVGSVFTILSTYGPLMHRLQSGEWGPPRHAPVAITWGLNISGAIFAISMVYGFLPDRLTDRIPNYVSWPLLFNGGIWLGISLWFWIGVLAVGVNTLFYRLPGKYFNIIAIAALPIGYAVHRFKRFKPIHYGAVEIMVGIATALGSTFSKKEFEPAQGLAVLGAIYVVASGFNNIYVARHPQSSNRRSGAIG